MENQIKFIESALEIANQKGCFSLAESSQVFKQLNDLKKESETLINKLEGIQKQLEFELNSKNIETVITKEPANVD